MARKIKRRDELLQNIAAGLNQHPRATLGTLEVVFYDEDTGEKVLVTGVATALDYLANDIYWDEESDWSNAGRAEVRTI